MEGGGTGSGSIVQLYLPHLSSITPLATDRPHSSDACCFYECRHMLLSWQSQAWRPGHFSSIGFTLSFVSVQMFEKITTGLLLLHIQDWTTPQVSPKHLPPSFFLWARPPHLMSFEHEDSYGIWLALTAQHVGEKTELTHSHNRTWNEDTDTENHFTWKG